MMYNAASYPFKSWLKNRIFINIKVCQIACMYVSAFFSEIVIYNTSNN